jgi:hypothetical protein
MSNFKKYVDVRTVRYYPLVEGQVISATPEQMKDNGRHAAGIALFHVDQPPPAPPRPDELRHYKIVKKADVPAGVEPINTYEDFAFIEVDS